MITVRAATILTPTAMSIPSWFAISRLFIHANKRPRVLQVAHATVLSCSPEQEEKPCQRGPDRSLTSTRGSIGRPLPCNPLSQAGPRYPLCTCDRPKTTGSRAEGVPSRRGTSFPLRRYPVSSPTVGPRRSDSHVSPFFVMRHDRCSRTRPHFFRSILRLPTWLTDIPMAPATPPV